VRLLITALVIAPFVASTTGQAEQTDDSLQTYVVQILQGSPQFVTGAGIYLGKGLVITAGHVAGPNRPGVLMGGRDFSAKILKHGSFETVDLALLSIDENELSISSRALRMLLCEKPAEVGASVIVAAPQGVTRSSIVSPLLLSPMFRTKWSTMISDVETNGKSGSGVVDAQNKCLLGILSVKVGNPNERENTGTYFVPATMIGAFVPTGTRW
jgi:hypothetical protein